MAVTRRTILKTGGLAALACAAGCAPVRGSSGEREPMSPVRVHGYHPVENGIPAKGHSMTYLLAGPGGGVLIDPGRGSYHDEMMAFVRHHVPEPGGVPIALLTHCHRDHTEGARFVEAEGMLVAASAATAAAVREASVEMGFSKGPRPEAAADVGRILHDGEILHVSGMRIEVVMTPGHTAGCTSYLVETVEGRTAFTGDLLMHTGQLGWSGGPSFSLEQSVASLERLIALQPDKAYWGHGEIEGGAVEWLEHGLQVCRAGYWKMTP